MFKRFGSFLILALIALALWKFREPLAVQLEGANPFWLVAAAFVAVIYLPLNASVWGGILHLMGERVDRGEATKLWIRCEAIRWVPGGIWGYASRVVGSREIGVSKLNGAVSLSIELLITIAAWGTLAVVGLVGSGYLPILIEACGPFLYYGLIAAGVGIILFFALKDQVVKIVAKRLSGLSEVLSHPFRFLKPWLEYVLLNSFVCLGPWFCFLAIHPEPVLGVVQTIGANALAWLVGFFAIFAPGGLGVREGAFALVYQPMGLAAQAGIAAIAWRAIQTATELFWLVVVNIIPERRKSNQVEGHG